MNPPIFRTTREIINFGATLGVEVVGPTSAPEWGDWAAATADSSV